MFSVVIPLYNKQHTILRTLYSVLTQTCAEFEIVLIDDGSSDESVELIEGHIKDPRLRIIRQPNQGVSVARNRGVEEAKHRYVAFLDADDEWLPTYLEKVGEAIVRFPEAGMYCTPALHRSLVTGQGHYYIVPDLKGQIQKIDYFRDPKRLGGQTSGVVVSKKIFNDVKENYEGGGFPVGLNLNEDWACFQTIALVSPAVYIGYSLSIRNTQVPGQLVDLSDDGLDMRLNKSTVYLNVTLRNYQKSGKRNPSFERYRRYEIRSNISFFIRRGHADRLLEFLDNLDPSYDGFMPRWEFWIYRKCRPSFVLPYIAITKIVFWLWSKFKRTF